MKIFVAGSRGQLGHALLKTFYDHDVIAADIDKLDVTQLEATRKVLEQARPDIVINAAAYTQVDKAETDIDAAYAANAVGPRNLALVTASLNVPLVHISTDYVFDGKNPRPYHEFDRTNPLSIYGRSKLAGEEAVRVSNPKHYIARTAWLYNTVGKNFPNTMCTLAEKKEVRVVSDQYGSPTFAPHLAAALARLIETDSFGTYHLAGSGGTTWFDFARTLFRYLGKQTQVIPISAAEYPRPACRPANAVLTTLQSPHFSLPPWEHGLKEFVQELHLSS